MNDFDLADAPTSVRETLVVHNTHRRATALLADVAARPEVPLSSVAELREWLVANLHHHHESEDDELWPMITSVAPDAAAPLAELSGEHEQLDAALEAVAGADMGDGADRDALVPVTDALRVLVHGHMDREEPVLFPALRAHVSEEAWDRFAAHVKATNPPVALHLMVGFIDLVGSKEEVELMLGGIPDPVLAGLREQARQSFALLGVHS